MLTKTSAELTLFDTLSRLTLARAAKLLGADGNRLIAAGGKYDIDVREVALASGIEELKQRLEVLPGAKAHAPVDETEKLRQQREAERLARRGRVAEAGSQLVAAAFTFLGEMIPQKKVTTEVEQMTRQFKARLDECMERDEKVVRDSRSRYPTKLHSRILPDRSAPCSAENENGTIRRRARSSACNLHEKRHGQHRRRDPLRAVRLPCECNSLEINSRTTERKM